MDYTISMKLSLLALLWILFVFPGAGEGKHVTFSKQDYRNGLIYQQFVAADVDESSAFVQKYRSVQRHVNLQVDYPQAVIHHIARDERGKVEFAKSYSTTKYGLRVVPENKKASKTLIVAGDSNIFGIGCNDNETLTAFLAPRLPDVQLMNFGLAGTAANAQLYFLNHFSLKEILGENRAAVMVYDFHAYLIERMIGSKNFIRWGWMQPAYELKQGKLVYTGTFNERWVTKFYKLVAFIDPKNFLFPNLPRIHDEHYQLVAHLFLELKNTFLSQTRADNQFYVLINPFSLNEDNRGVVRRVEEELKKVGVQTIRFDELEAINHISIYPRDLHTRPEGQDYYAGLIAQKVQPLLGTKRR